MAIGGIRPNIGSVAMRPAGLMGSAACRPMVQNPMFNPCGYNPASNFMSSMGGPGVLGQLLGTAITAGVQGLTMMLQQIAAKKAAEQQQAAARQQQAGAPAGGDAT